MSAATDGQGAWLELSVEADVEAVEAVSEILGRAAPGGVVVEPAFDLVEEGLGARVDPTRPATVRAYLPARDPAAAEAEAASIADALGHLQAFGLRPIGELRTRIVHEADWANAWKAYFPVLRVGRRLVIRPTWRRHKAVADELVLALDPGMAFGTGPPPDDAAVPRDARGGRGPRRRARRRPRPRCRVRVRDPGHRRDPPRGGARRRRRHRPDRHRGHGREREAQRHRATDPRPGRQPAERRPAFDVVVANLIAGVLVPLAGPLRDELRPGGILVASGIFIDREAEVRAAFETAGLVVDGRLDEGRLGGARGASAGLNDRSTLQSPSMPNLFPLLLATHITLAISLFLPSILLPFALRTRRATVDSDSRVVHVLLWGQSHGTVLIGLGLALTGLGLVAVLGSTMLQQPWLMVALTIYFANLAIAFFVQRPNLRRLVGVTAAADDEVWKERAKRQRYISYLMAGLVGTIGFLMSSKPILW